MIDVVEQVAEGRALVEWSTVRSNHKGMTLVIYVFRDAMKFDGVIPLEWDFDPVKKGDPWYTEEVFNGVRLPATALQLQLIADLTGCMLLTPKVIDMIWQQAGTRFDPVINTAKYPGAPANQRRIVANSHIHVVHQEIEAKIAAGGGDVGKLIAVVGKYWCLINALAYPKKLLYGANTACNYGWISKSASLLCVTPGMRCYQSPGFKHDHNHWDPSQTIRLMYRLGVLHHVDGRREVVDLRELAIDPERAPLISHEGVLRYLRQAVVPAPLGDVAIASYAPKLLAA